MRMRRHFRHAAALVSAASVAWVAAAGGGGAVYSEDFESFDLGPADGQQGWSSDDPINFEIIESGVAGFGSRSAAYIFDVDEPGIPSYVMRGPLFPRCTDCTVAIDMLIIGGNNGFTIVGYDANSPTFSNATVSLRDTRDIATVMMNLHTFGASSLGTDGSWVVGVPTRIEIDIPDDARFRIYQDGEKIFDVADLTVGIWGTRVDGVQQIRIGKGLDIPAFGHGVIIDNITVTPFSSMLLGDMNCDGLVSVADIGPFVMALTNPTNYAASFPDCDMMQADLSGDGLVTVVDIGHFVALLTN